MKKILITGSNSLLGTYVKQELTDFDSIITNHKDLDVTNKREVLRFIAYNQPDVIIHLAALSSIDYCQTHQTETNTVNVLGTANVLLAIKNKPVHFVFTSSSMVFDGSNAPYTEEATPHPINQYGVSKYEAEKRVFQHPFSTIVRCSTMFGTNPKAARNNDVTNYCHHLAKNEPIYLVTDRYFNPVYALRAAEVIHGLIKQEKTGIYHVGGKERINRLEFIKKIKHVFVPQSKTKLIGVTSGHFKELSPRPKDVTLTTNKVYDLKILKQGSLLKELSLMKEEPYDLLAGGRQA